MVVNEEHRNKQRCAILKINKFNNIDTWVEILKYEILKANKPITLNGKTNPPITIISLNMNGVTLVSEDKHCYIWQNSKTQLCAVFKKHSLDSKIYKQVKSRSMEKDILCK